VRFPIVGNICEELADEKVAIEVGSFNLIRENTTIPVPQIKAWGRAINNTLSLGLFMPRNLSTASVSAAFSGLTRRHDS
jgi:hypothetical protein